MSDLVSDLAYSSSYQQSKKYPRRDRILVLYVCLQVAGFHKSSLKMAAHNGIATQQVVLHDPLEGANL